MNVILMNIKYTYHLIFCKSYDVPGRRPIYVFSTRDYICVLIVMSLCADGKCPLLSQLKKKKKVFRVNNFSFLRFSSSLKAIVYRFFSCHFSNVSLFRKGFAWMQN